MSKGIQITGANTQIYALKNTENIRVKVALARTTEDEAVMAEILKSGTRREIIELAGNKNLTEDLSKAIIDKNIPQATQKLVTRRDDG